MGGLIRINAMSGKNSFSLPLLKEFDNLYVKVIKVLSFKLIRYLLSSTVISIGL